MPRDFGHFELAGSLHLPENFAPLLHMQYLAIGLQWMPNLVAPVLTVVLLTA